MRTRASLSPSFPFETYLNILILLDHHICLLLLLSFHFIYVTVLTSVHLRKAKLMFFYARYPSSSALKVFFPDVRFNKLITAQVVKWFSNFR